MCGIFGIISSKPVSQTIAKSLSRLSYRGYDSWGIAIPYCDKGQWNIGEFKKLGPIKERDILQFRDNPLGINQGCHGIGHTRWATHGEVSLANTHPFTDCHRQIAIAHNGIIENWRELKKALEIKGHIFVSGTDSEVIAHLLENYTGPLSSRLSVVASQLEGTYAIVACDKDGISAVHIKQPLLAGIGDNCQVVGSDTLAFVGQANQIIDIPEGIVIDLATYKPDRWYASTLPEQSVSLNGYEHYMLKEIMEQPESLKRALNQDQASITSLALDILSSNQVVLTGCGTSRFAALIGRYAFSSLRKKWATVIVGSELPLLVSSANNSFLVLAVSQSGETADITHNAQDLLAKGVTLASIVNSPQSQLARLSYLSMPLNAGPEYGVAATKTFTSELVVLYLITGAMTGMYSEMKDRIERIDLSSILGERKYIADLAARIARYNDVYFLARDSNYPLAGEAALKLKEVSCIHAEGLAAGELKHGTLALISKGTPVIGICPNDYTRQPMINNLQEVKARGGWIIGISDKESEVFDEWIKTPAVPEVLYPLVSVVPAQLLAYYAALARNLSPDFPRNLAKSVTVR